MSSKIVQNIEIIEQQRLMMSIAGIWMMENPTIRYRIVQFLSYFLGTILMFTMWIQIYACYDNFTELSEILYMASTMTSYIVKLFLLILNKKYIDAILAVVEEFDDETSEKFNKTVEEVSLFSSISSRIYISIAMTSSTLVGVFPMFENKSLVFPFPYFNDGIMRYLMYGFQWFSILISAWNNTCLDIFAAGLMLIAGAQLDILKQNIEFVVNSGEATEEQLMKCCVHHNKIINMVKNIENAFSVGVLAQFSSSIICICNTGFHFMLISFKSIQFIMLIFYFAAMLCQLGIYCWFGNEIIIKSIEIRDACYNSLWYEINPKLVKYIFLIMERSKRPLTIYAYKLSSLSLASFMSIMHWSYSYFALLKRLYANSDTM